MRGGRLIGGSARVSPDPTQAYRKEGQDEEPEHQQQPPTLRVHNRIAHERQVSPHDPGRVAAERETPGIADLVGVTLGLEYRLATCAQDTNDAVCGQMTITDRDVENQHLAWANR